jgi:glucose/arabinose dehydrogenase
VFTPGWDVVLNMGSGTDRCLESLPADRCHDEEEHTAALWRYRYLGERRWAAEPEHLAHGLRNSVALVAHGSGTILQGENGSDFREADRPHEELNVVEAGRHYGWPYCYEREERDPEWAHSSFACDPRRNPTYAPPHLLLPAHGAPLGMMYYEGARLPELAGELLIALHGHRDGGHRVLALDVDARGVPAADAQLREVIAGWDPSESGPRGAPVDMTTASDGSVWLVEDTNGTVLRLSTDAYAPSLAAGPTPGEPELEADPAFVTLHRDVLRPRCSACHDHLAGDAESALRGLSRQGWLAIDEGEPRMWQRVRDGAERPMPPDRPLPASERAALRRWLDARDR